MVPAQGIPGIVRVDEMYDLENPIGIQILTVGKI